MRHIWYLLGAPRELRCEENDPDREPSVGQILGGREVVRVWPYGDQSHSWRVLFEVGVLGAENLEEKAREYKLWEPTERVLELVAELGLEIAHVAGETALHQMVFVVRHEQAPESQARGVGVFPLQAVVDYARRNGFAPAPQAAGTVVPMPMLRRQEDGTIAGPGVAISDRLREFFHDERNAMPSRDWAALLLTFAADYAIDGGLNRATYVTADGDVYDDRRKQMGR